MSKETNFLAPQDDRQMAFYRCASFDDVTFKLKKRCQLFVGADDESLSAVAMRVCNEDCLPVAINR